ncbi:DEAD/DEAH box helicase [Domibacillus antri]|uniref:DEAD/DEAH box helicase n=1 Tax=Domibacillus antri TaxID=1714264 RepID=A0A1Q8Q3P6_9BACI|nr:DEAD/DEAH box helicase [Domibacillus antri]OLN21891.1 DEAD/DEAH box helicase [Domibacillus antri]
MTIEFQPHPYQAFAIDQILKNKSYGLFLDMGLGKTVSTLTAIEKLMFDDLEVSKVLVIAPKRVAEDTWSREVFKWSHTAHLRVSKVLGTEKQRRQALQKDADIYVINRENVEWLVNLYQGKPIPFDMLVVDELSSFKSPSSNRFKALRKIRPSFKRFVGLTGTPAPNSLLDLWSQVYLIDRGERLGKTMTQYRNRYFYPAQTDPVNPRVVYKYEPRPEAEKNIYELIDDICVSMKAKDHLQLPERIDNIVTVTMSAKERAEYGELERERILECVSGDIVASTAGVLSQKLLQLSNGACYNENQGVQHIHDRKLDALEDLVEGAQGQPILLFYSFKHDRDRIMKKFKRAVSIDADHAIERWNNGEIELLLAHPASAGHGLNLQYGGHIIVWFGLTWSLELYQQANARLHRQGQEQTVIVHHILTSDTIDQRVLDVLQGKEKGQEALLAALKAKIDEYGGEADG